jgi:hypothetical protein
MDIRGNSQTPARDTAQYRLCVSRYCHIFLCLVITALIRIYVKDPVYNLKRNRTLPKPCFIEVEALARPE